MAVEFRADLCSADTLPIIVRYSGNPPDVDLSELITVHLRKAAAPTMLFVATYDRADESIRFRGIEVASAQSQCVGALSTVVGLDTTPLLLTTQLAPGWRDGRLFERLQ